MPSTFNLGYCCCSSVSPARNYLHEGDEGDYFLWNATVSLAECWCDHAAGIWKEFNISDFTQKRLQYSTKLFIASSSTHQSHMAYDLPYITPVTWLTISQHPSPTTPLLQFCKKASNLHMEDCRANSIFSALPANTLYTACCQLN